MNIRLYPLMTLALLTLVSCVPKSQPEHCITKINPFDMSEENLMTTCHVDILPTTMSAGTIISNVPTLTNLLAQSLTEKNISTINGIHHLTVVHPEDQVSDKEYRGKPDYILTSNIDEFILTDEKININDDFKDQKQATAAVTYNLISTLNSKVVFSNTINVSLVQKVYDPAVAAKKPTINEIANHVINDVSRLFKHNVMNELNPIRIIDINDNGLAIFNQPVAANTSCYVYYPNKYNPSVIDNYTDEEGTVKATLQVVESSPTATLATIKSGFTNKSDICRTKFFSEKLDWETFYF